MCNQLGELNIFLERHKLEKLTQKKKKKRQSEQTYNRIFVICNKKKKHFTRKNPGPDGFNGEF